MKIANKKGVFGLTSVQAFFAIILAVALLAYVIVVIMSTLQTTAILPAGTVSGGTVTNESLIATTSPGTALTVSTYSGCVATVTAVWNDTANAANVLIGAGNYSTAGCYFYNTTNYAGASGALWNVTYTYVYDSSSRIAAGAILGNTSKGITSFFGSITPVYAILAILVIILVLVVLVRVVTGGTGSQTRAGEAPL